MRLPPKQSEIVRIRIGNTVKITICFFEVNADSRTIENTLFGLVLKREKKTELRLVGFK